jgi:hypothetical protein
MLLSPDDRRSVRGFNEFFEKERVVKLFLKELKSKKNKEKTAPAPHRKEKTIKEKSQKTHTQEERVAMDDLAMRKKAFRDECHQFDARYGRDVVDDFYVYWSEESKRDGRMLWEYQRTWSTAKRLFKWSRNPISDAKKAAAIKLARAEKKYAPQAVNTQELQALAAKRAEDNEKLEQEIAARKAGAASMEEVAGADPNRLRTIQNLLATNFESPTKKKTTP